MYTRDLTGPTDTLQSLKSHLRLRVELTTSQVGRVIVIMPYAPASPLLTYSLCPTRTIVNNFSVPFLDPVSLVRLLVTVFSQTQVQHSGASYSLTNTTAFIYKTLTPIPKLLTIKPRLIARSACVWWVTVNRRNLKYLHIKITAYREL